MNGLKKPIHLAVSFAACFAVAWGFLSYGTDIFKSSVMGITTFCFVYFIISCFIYKPEGSE